MMKLKTKHATSLIALLLVVCMSLAGCTAGSNVNANVPEQNPADAVLSMEDEAVLEYAIPEQHPGLVVDRSGYSLLEKKYAYAVTKYYPGDFKIVNEENGEVVFEGTPEHIARREEDGLYVSELIFEEVQKEGTYHIEMDMVGDSYSFTVDDTLFTDKYNSLLEEEIKKCKDDSLTIGELYSLTYVVDCYTQSVPDHDEAEPELVAALKTFIDGADVTAIPESDMLKFAAALARFSFYLSGSDKKTSDTYINTAKEVFKDAIKNVSGLDEDDVFLALCELYRRTGDRAYYNEIEKLKSSIMEKEYPLNSRSLLYGAMTYMTTTKTVNVDFCEYLMKQLLTLCEDISKDDSIADVMEGEDADVSLILGYCQQLAALNGVLEGYQYNALLTNYMHFLNGRNYAEIDASTIEEWTADSIILYSWLTLVEKEGKMSPSAQLSWSY